MNPLDWLLKGRFGAAARAGGAFIAISIAGAIGLVVVAIVLWAASLTPFGLWAGIPVIAAGALAAFALWRSGTTSRLDVALPASPTDATTSPRTIKIPKTPTTPRFRLIGSPAPLQLRSMPVREPVVPNGEDLRRRFDQAFAAGHYDDADRILTDLAAMPGQSEWTRRKQRLVRQLKARS